MARRKRKRVQRPLDQPPPRVLPHVQAPPPRCCEPAFVASARLAASLRLCALVVWRGSWRRLQRQSSSRGGWRRGRDSVLQRLQRGAVERSHSTSQLHSDTVAAQSEERDTTACVGRAFLDSFGSAVSRRTPPRYIDSAVQQSKPRACMRRRVIAIEQIEEHRVTIQCSSVCVVRRS